jgi:hypothetical protein
MLLVCCLNLNNIFSLRFALRCRHATSNKLSQVSLLPAVNYRRRRCYRWQINRRCHWIERNPGQGLITGRPLSPVNSLSPVSTTPAVNANLRIFAMDLMGYSGAGGQLIHEKNLKSKISSQTPFKASFRIWLKMTHCWVKLIPQATLLSLWLVSHLHWSRLSALFKVNVNECVNVLFVCSQSKAENLVQLFARPFQPDLSDWQPLWYGGLDPFAVI